MAIKFGSSSLQQRVIKKVQDQINQRASGKRDANSADIEKFKTHMGYGERNLVKDQPGQEEDLTAIKTNQVTSTRDRQVSVMQDSQKLPASAESDSLGKAGGLPYKSPGDKILETLAEMSKGVKQIDSTAATETTEGY